jgi:acetyl esterase
MFKIAACRTHWSKTKAPKAEPHMQKVLDALASLAGKPIETLTPEELKKAFAAKK